MSRNCRPALSLLFALTVVYLSAQETIVPTPVAPNLVPTAPYSYNGLITAYGALGSASMIGEGVFATAAHVLYDEDNFQWAPIYYVKYFPQSDSNATGSPFREKYTPVALFKWDAYGTRVQNDDSGPGLSTPDTFNLDFGVGYFSSSTTVDSILEHAELNIDSEGDVTILRHNREKMVVGYPQDVVPDQGLMHFTQPGNYYAYDAIYEDYDSEALWAAVYNFDGVTTYSGNSGGPIYVRDDMDNWMMAGVLDGSNGSSGMLVRAIDDNAWELVEQAITARNQNALVRVDDLHVVGTPDSIEIAWTDHSSEEIGYSVFRHEQGLYEEIAVLPANSQGYVDASIKSGHVYHYRVQPFDSLGNKAPKSKSIMVNVPGIHKVAEAYLNLDGLRIRSTGDSSWFIDGSNKLRAGVVHSMGSSSLTLDIIGPGTIFFDWTASCEENPEYAIPGAQYEGDIYDAIWLYMDDVQVVSGDEPIFLSGPPEDDATGTKGPVGVQYNVPEGPHQIEWRYQKDPYTDQHQDTGFLDSLSWTPDPASPYPVYGAYALADSSWHNSPWFGLYNVQHWPWVAHEKIGWLYMLGGTSAQGMYIHCHDARIGTLYTTPEYWPFLYQPLTDTWIYFFEGTGDFGSGALFWDFENSQLVSTDG
jgi:hypothetical protein